MVFKTSIWNKQLENIRAEIIKKYPYLTTKVNKFLTLSFQRFILKSSINLLQRRTRNIQKSIPDYAFKSQVLKTDFPAIQKAISYGKFKYIDQEPIYEKLVEQEMKFLTNPDTAIYYCEAKKINEASYKRGQRLNQRIKKIIQKPSVFITLTFTDKVLNVTNPETRKKYVKRFLSSFGVPYVANLDFGSRNGREHYHAILQEESINPLQWKYGALNVKKIRSTEDSAALAKYVSKLTNHAIKESTKRSVIIYSRE